MGERKMLHKNSKNTLQMQIISIEQIVPEDHFLRKVDKYINFDFIYSEVEELYCLDTGKNTFNTMLLRNKKYETNNKRYTSKYSI